MLDDFEITDCQLFAAYAASDPQKWHTIEHCAISHVKYGQGIVERIEAGSTPGTVYVFVGFPASDSTKRFKPEAFMDERFFSALDIPIEIPNRDSLMENLELTLQELRAARAIREAAYQKQRFDSLKRKFEVLDIPESDPASPLYRVLLGLENREPLDSQTIQWLEHHRLYRLIALSYEQQIETSGDAWNAISACNYWRKAGDPERAVRVTAHQSPGNPSEKSALRATREGALEEIRAAKAAEEAAQKATQQRRRDAEHFGSLKERFEVAYAADADPASPLYKVLLELEGRETLDYEDLQWLKQQHLYNLIALNYEQRFEKDDDIWNIIQACSNWRRAMDPERALRVTEHQASDDPTKQAALLTTRGGALRDCADLPEAKALAEKACELTPRSYYPYNLLGAILYQQGEPEQGDKQFAKAVELGAPAEKQDHEIRSAVDKIDDEVLKWKVIEYLRKKDPVHYAWAKHR